MALIFVLINIGDMTTRHGHDIGFTVCLCVVVACMKHLCSLKLSTHFTEAFVVVVACMKHLCSLKLSTHFTEAINT